MNQIKWMIVLMVGLIPLLLIGCTSTSSTSYRPSGSTAPAWQINATWNQASDNVTVTINGVQVIKGKVGFFSTSKTLEGTYEGHKIITMLTKSTSFLGKEGMVCVITVDGEMAAKFDW